MGQLSPEHLMANVLFLMPPVGNTLTISMFLFLTPSSINIYNLGLGRRLSMVRDQGYKKELDTEPRKLQRTFLTKGKTQPRRMLESHTDKSKKWKLQLKFLSLFLYLYIHIIMHILTYMYIYAHHTHTHTLSRTCHLPVSKAKNQLLLSTI